MELWGIPIRQSMDVIKAIEPDPKEVVGNCGAVAFVGINDEDPRWVCIIIGFAHRSKSNLYRPSAHGPS